MAWNGLISPTPGGKIEVLQVATVKSNHRRVVTYFCLSIILDGSTIAEVSLVSECSHYLKAMCSRVYSMVTIATETHIHTARCHIQSHSASLRRTKVSNKLRIYECPNIYRYWFFFLKNETFDVQYWISHFPYFLAEIVTSISNTAKKEMVTAEATLNEQIQIYSIF